MTGEGAAPATLGALVDALAARHPDLPALVASDASAGTGAPLRISFSELAAEVHALHAGLDDLGVRPGDRVAVLLSSVPEWLYYCFATTRLGAVFVPINPRYGTREIAHVLRHSEATALVAMGHYLGRDYAAAVAEVAGDWARGSAAAALPRLRHLIGLRGLALPAAIDSAELRARGIRRLAHEGIPPTASDAESMAMLFYTSGTTASPKGVGLTHANFLPHTLACGRLFDLHKGEPSLTLFPFFGISGINKVVSTLGCGSCLVFQDSFRAEEAFALMLGEDCRVIHALDVQVRELVEIARKRGAAAVARRGSVAFVTGVNEALVAEMGETLGLERFVHAYGMTEMNPMVLRNELDDPLPVRIRAGGRVAPGVEVKLLDPDSGLPSAIGVAGEIVVRGPNVMPGYYRDPDATAQVFRDGWFHTGDLGLRTEDGFIFYVGRLKDMLKTGGFNVAPAEIEECLESHAAVEDAAVAGLADARLGEVPVAFVKLRRGAGTSAAELQAFCRGQIANFKVPRRIYLVEALPYHTAAHGPKLQRAVLRDWAQERAATETEG